MKKIVVIAFCLANCIALIGQEQKDSTKGPEGKHNWSVSFGATIITMKADASYPHRFIDRYKNSFGFFSSEPFFERKHGLGRFSPVFEITYHKYHSLGISYSSSATPDEFFSSELRDLQFYYRLNLNYLNYMFKIKGNIEPFLNLQYTFNYKRINARQFVYPLPMSWNCNPPNPMYKEDRFVSLIQLVAGIKSNRRRGFFFGLNMNLFAASFGEYSSLVWGDIDFSSCQIITTSGRTDDIVLLDKILKNNFFLNNISVHFKYDLKK